MWLRLRNAGYLLNNVSELCLNICALNIFWFLIEHIAVEPIISFPVNFMKLYGIGGLPMPT
jgi:hypothetical protein